MQSIVSLFKETKDVKYSDEEKKRIGRANKYIKDITILPDFHCPDIDSSTHKKDIETVKHYFYNKSLNKDFLDVAHDSCKKIYKKYCKDNNIKVDWKFIKEVLKDVESITHSLKRKFNRPRPKEILAMEDSNFKNVKDMGSASFPSGHTTTAYFVSELLSHFFPHSSNDFKTIAELIGQSRIENSVHYPSDVLYGKLLGEMLANLFIASKDNAYFDKILKSNVVKKDQKEFSKYLRSLALKEEHSEKRLSDYARSMAEFMCRSNEIEEIRINYDECFRHCLSFLSGYPVNSKNNHINSCFKGLCASYKFKDIESPYTTVSIHKLFHPSILSRGKPGVLRSEERHSQYGNSYSKPEDIFNHMKKLGKAKSPFIKHMLFEWIHPFSDGNGRTGRIILAADLDYDFEKVNSFCDRDYIPRIHHFVDKYESIENILE